MGRHKIDHSGRVSGRLTVLGPSGSGWLCLCTCGSTKVLPPKHLGDGSVLSCGCLREERKVAALTTHGMYGTGTYKSWRSMVDRCTNPNSTAYHRYGGRGIRVCKSWMSFSNFFEDMGERPVGKTLGRFPDNDGDYTKSNCRWETVAEQMLTRSSPHQLPRATVTAMLHDVQGGATISSTAKKFKVSRSTLYRYLALT